MTGRRRDTRSLGYAGQTASEIGAAGRGSYTAAEDVSFCELASRLCPWLDPRDILKHVQKQAAERNRRVRGLGRRVRSGNYHVQAAAVVNAILAGDGAIVH